MERKDKTGNDMVVYKTERLMPIIVIWDNELFNMFVSVLLFCFYLATSTLSAERFSQQIFSA